MCKYPKNTWSCWKCKEGYAIQDEEYRCKFYNCEGKCIEAKSTPTSKGSCYTFWDHTVSCDVAKEDCGTGKAYYEPGYVGSSGCCHCEASCDHTKETAKDACEYYDANGGSEADGAWTTAAGPRRRRTHRERSLRFPRRRLLDSVTRATQVDGQEPAALAQADAPARALPGQRFRGGRGVGTRAFLRSFVVAVLTPPPSLPPVYYNTLPT